MPEYEDEETHTKPFTQQPSFAGSKRRRIDFVPQSRPRSPDPAPEPNEKDATSIQDLYLSIVLSKERPASGKLDAKSPTQHLDSEALHADNLEGAASEDVVPGQLEFCAICNLPISEAVNGIPHEASLSHQVCLEHSHPPSAMDRRRKGYTYLSAYGWDPDERKGLGASGQGRLDPVQAQKREGNLGLGSSKSVKDGVKKPQLLNAKQVREAERANNKKSKQLHNLFYGRDDIGKYLGAEH